MKKFFINNDIDEIITRTRNILDQLANKHIVLTGGRGFLGRYLAEIFFKYNEILDKPIKLTVIDNLSVSGELGSTWPNYSNFKFIKADVFRFDDMMQFGSEKALAEKGLIRQEGKQYIVQEGDCIFFRFNI